LVGATPHQIAEDFLKVAPADIAQSWLGRLVHSNRGPAWPGEERNLIGGTAANPENHDVGSCLLTILERRRTAHPCPEPAATDMGTSTQQT